MFLLVHVFPLFDCAFMLEILVGYDVSLFIFQCSKHILFDTSVLGSNATGPLHVKLD